MFSISKYRLMAFFILLLGLSAGWLFFNRVEIKQDIEEWQRKRDLPPAIISQPAPNSTTIKPPNHFQPKADPPLAETIFQQEDIKEIKEITEIKDIIEEEKIIPPEINIAVPFLVQAPYAVWDQLHEEACEEAVLIMFSAFYQGIQKISQDEAELAIQNLVKWEKENLGFFESTNAEENVRILKEYFGLSGARAVYDITVEDIKKELAAGRPVVVPAAGKMLPNPYFRNGGPIYHMVLIKGYTKDGRFITNDAGTKRGADFTYKFEDLYNAIHDWVPGGEIEEGRKVMVVVE